MGVYVLAMQLSCPGANVDGLTRFMTLNTPAIQTELGFNTVTGILAPSGGTPPMAFLDEVHRIIKNACAAAILADVGNAGETVDQITAFTGWSPPTSANKPHEGKPSPILVSLKSASGAMRDVPWSLPAAVPVRVAAQWRYIDAGVYLV